MPGRNKVSIAWTITQSGTGAVIDTGTSRHTVCVTAAAHATPFGAGSDQVRYPYETLVDVGAVAAGGHGELLAEQGEVQGARDAYQKAIDSGHADQAPMAALGLGRLPEEQGHVPGN